MKLHVFMEVFVFRIYSKVVDAFKKKTKLLKIMQMTKIKNVVFLVF